MVVNVLKPIIQRKFYFHSYGSIPGKGAHNAKKYIERWIRCDVKNTKYVLQMDVKKYFESIDHDILKRKISRIIKDEKFLKILFTIIDVTPKGIPLGFYTSQWLANFFLSDLDYYIKQELKAKYYVRYMDDMVILGSNKRRLHKIEIAINSYLNNEELEMKYTHQVFLLKYNETRGRCLDFMGFKFYRNRTTLRKKIYIRMCRKARKLYIKDKISIYECRQMLSYIGWLKCTDTYNAYFIYIKPYVDIGKLKKRISNYDRRNSACGKSQNLKLCHS